MPRRTNLPQPPPSDGDLYDRIKSLEMRVASLEQELRNLNAQLAKGYSILADRKGTRYIVVNK